MKYGKFVELTNLSSELMFVAKAIGDEEERPQLKYIHIEPSRKSEGLLGIATDGRRIHMVDPIDPKIVEHFELNTGFWRVVKKTLNCLQLARLDDSETAKLTFPNWDKVVPSDDAEFITTFQGFSRYKNHWNLSKLIRGFPEHTPMSLRYLRALGTTFTWDVRWYANNKAVKFTAGNYTAVIMPLADF